MIPEDYKKLEEATDDLTVANVRYKQVVEEQRKEIMELNYRIKSLEDERIQILGEGGAKTVKRMMADLQGYSAQAQNLEKIILDIINVIPERFMYR